ncbi:MAG: PQQ-binding-like beta-propeller repeat protein [Planctomycetes bacterium]|nr:PQQ-binding-like beta-propeller repeat protein [Planctomycetota bacterium]
MKLSVLAIVLVISGHLGPGTALHAEDWTAFRGSDGSAISRESQPPLTWSETEHLRWKTKLPGAGSSSPIVLGDKVFVTCYSGYGVPPANGGNPAALQRHLVCVQRADGQILWQKSVPAAQPEDAYQGYLTQHGYASSTPVTDGERVFVFFGKTGVVAFDLTGQHLWTTRVGDESSNRHWGSGASLIVHRQHVIVNASEESQSVRALDRVTGKQVWSASGAALELAYGTPAVVTHGNQLTDIVIAAPGEIWGINADTGKMRWYAEHRLTGNVSPSVITQGDQVFVFGGFQSSGSFALRAGGEKNVTKSAMLWTSRQSSYVATPVLYAGHLYWINDQGQAYCVQAQNGDLVYRERVPGLDAGGGRPVYASPVVAGGRIYVPTRWSGVLVLPAEPRFEILAQNRFAQDDSDFNATPAISQNELFLRSNRCLYCVSASKP